MGSIRQRWVVGVATSVLAVGMAQAGPKLWIDDSSGVLGNVDVDTGAVTVIGPMGVTMLDIAFDPLGTLWGINALGLYRINTTTAVPSFVGLLGASVNSLVFGSNGTLYAAGNALFTVSTATGAATRVGNGGVSYNSSGDLAFIGGQLHLASTQPTADSLVRLNTSTGAATLVGAFGRSQVWGMASDNGSSLYAVSGTQIYSVNPSTGATTLMFNYAGAGLNAAYGTTFLGEAIPIPEPTQTTLLLAGLGVVGWLAARRRAAA